MSVVRWDKKHLWHPFTQQSEWEASEPLVIDRAKGRHLISSSGRPLLDGVSSLWVTTFGHNEPALNRALTRQLKKMAHVTFLGLTHAPAARLAKELTSLAPRGLSRVFYSDNGSTAVEVAVKMAFQQARDHRKNEFITLEGAYHGDTLGAVSVGGVGLFHDSFKPLLFKTHKALSPHCYRCRFRRKPAEAQIRPGTGSVVTEAPKPGDDNPVTGCRWECLGSVERVMKARAGRLAALIVEPLVQGASGILVQPEGYLKGVSRLARRHGVPLIADEVATGFGRTGRMFAVGHEGVSPDFMALSKSITGGYLPLAATLATEKTYRAFLGRYDQFKTFFHGHTYTANPLACAVALENLRLYRERRLLERLVPAAERMASFLREMAERPFVGHVRQMGVMAGLELVREKASGRSFRPGLRVGHRVCLAARRYGVWLRPLGDVIVLMPPLGITPSELGTLFSAVRRAVVDVTEKG